MARVCLHATYANSLTQLDASASVTTTVLEQQLTGHAAAFRDPLVQAALRSGPHGRIGVGVMLWSNPTDTRLTIPWRVLRGDEDAGESKSPRV